MTLPSLDAPECVLVRYGELALKGSNRERFERTLMRNLRDAVRPISPARIERLFGRLMIFPERRTAAVARRAQEVFGIKSVSPAWPAETDPAALTLLAEQVFEQAADDLATPPDRAPTFRVRVKRADKRFPMKSEAFEREVGGRLGALRPGFRVNLGSPDLEVGIDIRTEGSYVFVQRHPGPGGLPVGSIGRVLCLLSGGIDSPVAAWMAMKRGCQVSYLNFHSAAYVGEGARKKVQDIVRALAPWQPSSRLFIAPFTEIQEAVRDLTAEKYRTILYRRAMFRIAERLALQLEFTALVTGDNLGQVASQTLENLACLEPVCALPVLRPLICFDKEETIDLARRIGTLDASLVQAPDACMVFQPRRPELRGRLFDCERLEGELDMEGLIERCIAGVELWKVEAE